MAADGLWEVNISGVGINGAPVLEHHREFTQLIIMYSQLSNTFSLREYHYYYY